MHIVVCYNKLLYAKQGRLIAIITIIIVLALFVPELEPNKDPDQDVSNKSVDENYYTVKSINKPIQLTRSTTTIIDIPGVPVKIDNDSDSDCHCDACMEWVEFNHHSDCNRSLNTTITIDNSPDTITGEMKKIYRSLDNIEPKHRYINRSGYVLRNGVYNKAKPVGKVTTKRLVKIIS